MGRKVGYNGAKQQGEIGMPQKRRSLSRKPSHRHRISEADKEALQQLDHLLELQRRREQLVEQVPSGVITDRAEGERGATIYSFSHQEYGPLGRLHITPVPYMNACSIDVDMVESDPEVDPRW